MKKLIAILICVLGILSVNAHSAMFSYETLISQHDEYITNIKTIGKWTHSKQKGFYRIVYVEHLLGCSWLYIQWMNNFGEDGVTRIIKNLSIYDNDHHENTFDMPVVVENKKGLLVKYIEYSGHDDKRYGIEIQVFNEPGKYKMNRTQVKTKSK